MVIVVFYRSCCLYDRLGAKGGPQTEVLLEASIHVCGQTMQT